MMGRVEHRGWPAVDAAAAVRDALASPVARPASSGLLALDRGARTIAVALHDVEPATFERCAVMRDWLADHGIERVTLLVIPARDLHPAGRRSPEMMRWLAERQRTGDAIAQHGFHHGAHCRAATPGRDVARSWRAVRGEFGGLDPAETRRAVEAGWRLLKLGGVEPTGFVAPAYAYTAALHEALAARFRWWAGLWRLHRQPHASNDSGRGQITPAWRLGGPGPLGHLATPLIARGATRWPSRTLRLDLHPTDVQHPRHMQALERLLLRERGRRSAVSYDDLSRTG